MTPGRPCGSSLARMGADVMRIEHIPGALTDVVFNRCGQLEAFIPVPASDGSRERLAIARCNDQCRRASRRSAASPTRAHPSAPRDPEACSLRCRTVSVRILRWSVIRITTRPHFGGSNPDRSRCVLSNTSKNFCRTSAAREASSMESSPSATAAAMADSAGAMSSGPSPHATAARRALTALLSRRPARSSRGSTSWMKYGISAR
jgi:hypothetical protein